MLVIFFVISIVVSASMVMDRAADITGQEAGDNMVYKISQMYFRYQQKLKQNRTRNRRRERQMKRRERGEERKEIEDFRRIERQLL